MLSDDEIDAAILTDYPAAYSLLGGALTAGDFKIALRRVARTVERAAYERAAQECERIAERHWDAYKGHDGHRDPATHYNPHEEGLSDGAAECIDAIRALGSKK